MRGFREENRQPTPRRQNDLNSNRTTLTPEGTTRQQARPTQLNSHANQPTQQLGWRSPAPTPHLYRRSPAPTPLLYRRSSAPTPLLTVRQLGRRSPAPTPHRSVGGALLPRRTSLSAEPCSHAAPLLSHKPAACRFGGVHIGPDSYREAPKPEGRAAVNRGRWGKPTEENEKSRGISSDAFKKVTTTMSPSPVRTSGQGFHPEKQTGWRRESVASEEGMAPEGVNDLCTSKPGRAFARGSTP